MLLFNMDMDELKKWRDQNHIYPLLPRKNINFYIETGKNNTS